jgi:hypothetical protein
LRCAALKRIGEIERRRRPQAHRAAAAESA